MPVTRNNQISMVDVDGLAPGRYVSGVSHVMAYQSGFCSAVSRLLCTLGLVSHVRRYVGRGTDLTHLSQDKMVGNAFP